MAKHIITTISDDLDGSDADETVTFGIDGVAYEIDLSDKNAAKLREFLTAYQQAGTRVGKLDAVRRGSSYSSGSANPNFQANKELNARIRQWAASNGYQLNDRGRIAQHIVDAFHQGIPNPQAKQPPVAEPEPVVEPEPKSDKVVVPRRRSKPPAAKFSGAKA